MRPPFPGMDPWLEHPAIWPDVHNSLIAAIRDDLAPRLAPRYYVGLEQRAYQAKPDDVALVGMPDVAIIPSRPIEAAPGLGPAGAGVGVLDVELVMNDEVKEWFLEVHAVGTGKLVTVIEVLSPVNKLHPKGRRKYERKREDVLLSRTSLVEIDLLRAGEPMPLTGRPARSDYRILVSRSSERPRAKLHVFNLRDPIPPIPVPLLRGDDEPLLDLGAVLHALYDRARFDLRLDYREPPVPPLDEAAAGWAREVLKAR